jgi:RHS repeat-associated protein
VYLHQGGRYDSETGLYDFRNRFYDPEKGRWLNLDPIGFDAGDSNLYRYEGDGPTNATDPSGLGSLKETPLPKGLIQLNYWRAFLFRGPAQDIGGDTGVFVGVYDRNTGKVKRGNWIVDYEKVKESAESLFSGPVTEQEWAEWFASHAENRYQDLPEKWDFENLRADSDRRLNQPGYDANRTDAVKQIEGFSHVALAASPFGLPFTPRGPQTFVRPASNNARPQVMRGAEARTRPPTGGAGLPSRAAINKATKILTQYERLAQKYGIRLSPRRIEELNRLRDAGRISTSDLPAGLLREFPGELAGLSLEDIGNLLR